MNTTVSTLSLAHNHLTISIGNDDESDESDDPNIPQLKTLRRIKEKGLDIEMYSNNTYHEFIIHDAEKTILHEFPTTYVTDNICVMWADSNNDELYEIQLTSNVSVTLNKIGTIEKILIKQ
jgi:hypothetical protein